MEFINKCETMQSIPTDLDEVFVIGISYKVNKNKKIKHLRVVFTTLMYDAVDLANKFHPTVLMVTKREKAKDFAFMFSTIVCKLELLFNYTYEPNTL
jgi:hypothetical protein